MNTMIFKGYVLNNLVGGAMTRFTLEIISKFQIIVPSFAEQEAIIIFLDQTTATIDRQKAQVIEAIERLKEYRSALITDTVTGTISTETE
jgi:type I restriction enzyme, S subunit